MKFIYLTLLELSLVCVGREYHFIVIWRLNKVTLAPVIYVTYVYLHV